MQPRSSKETLLDRTRQLLQEAKKKGITNLQIFEATRLKPNWISRVLNDEDYDPSVKRVQTLHDYLAGKQ